MIVMGLLGAPRQTFVGRSAEMEIIDRALLDHRLLTIVGPGGVGKTTLAIEAALALGARFAQGVRSVELAGLGDPSLVESSVLGALQDLDYWGVESLAAVGVHDPDVLVLLDNCEHLGDSAGLAAAELLASASRLRIIATSRSPLGSPSEVVLPLDPLSNEEAVCVFLDRARHHDLRFQPDDAGTTAIERICRRLEGLPLAVELAAVHVRTLDLYELERRLDDQLRFLRRPGGRVHDRHTTLEATLRWGFDLLGPEQQRFLPRLAVFPGSFSAAAVERVCTDETLPADSVYPLLLELVESSFVTTFDHGAHRRFRLLEPIRQFATGLLREVDDLPALDPDVVLRQDGRHWVVGSVAHPSRIEATKGLAYLARLVRSPHIEISALELVGAAVSSADLGPMLDRDAKRAYRQRLEALDDEIERARRRGDVGQEERLDAERDQIVRELAAATGLGGRPRAAGSSEAERARTSVTKAIRGAIARIAAEEPMLGDHLRRSVRTGTSCVYTPDENLHWHL